MSVKNISNIAASVKARLMNFARERKAAFNVILIRYANERFLSSVSTIPSAYSLEKWTGMAHGKITPSTQTHYNENILLCSFTTITGIAGKLDKLILPNEQQLRYVIREYLEYYNHERPHSGLGGRMIKPTPQPKTGRIVRRSRLGCLLNTYVRVPEAA